MFSLSVLFQELLIMSYFLNLVLFFLLNRFVTLGGVTGVTPSTVTLSKGECKYLKARALYPDLD